MWLGDKQLHNFPQLKKCDDFDNLYLSSPMTGLKSGLNWFKIWFQKNWFKIWQPKLEFDMIV